MSERGHLWLLFLCKTKFDLIGDGMTVQHWDTKWLDKHNQTIETRPPRNCMVRFARPYHYQSINHCTNRFTSEYAHVLLCHFPFSTFYSPTEPPFVFFLFQKSSVFFCWLIHCSSVNDVMRESSFWSLLIPCIFNIGIESYIISNRVFLLFGNRVVYHF